MVPGVKPGLQNFFIVLSLALSCGLSVTRIAEDELGRQTGAQWEAPPLALGLQRILPPRDPIKGAELERGWVLGDKF